MLMKTKRKEMQMAFQENIGDRLQQNEFYGDLRDFLSGKFIIKLLYL